MKMRKTSTIVLTTVIFGGFIGALTTITNVKADKVTVENKKSNYDGWGDVKFNEALTMYNAGTSVLGAVEFTNYLGLSPSQTGKGNKLVFHAVNDANKNGKLDPGDTFTISKINIADSNSWVVRSSNDYLYLGRYMNAAVFNYWGGGVFETGSGSNRGFLTTYKSGGYTYLDIENGNTSLDTYRWTFGH